MNEPGAIPYFEARESFFASRLEHSYGLFDRGRVGCVGHQLDGTDVPMAHKVAAHNSLPLGIQAGVRAARYLSAFGVSLGRQRLNLAC